MLGALVEALLWSVAGAAILTFIIQWYHNQLGRQIDFRRSFLVSAGMSVCATIAINLLMSFWHQLTHML